MVIKSAPIVGFRRSLNLFVANLIKKENVRRTSVPVVRIFDFSPLLSYLVIIEVFPTLAVPKTMIFIKTLLAVSSFPLIVMK